MNYQSQNNQVQLSEAIQTFISATGIQIYTVLRNDSTSLNQLRKQCMSITNDILSLFEYPLYCNLFFCPNGYCHIIADSSFDSSVLFVSEPIICGASDVTVCIAHPDKPSLHLPPVKLYNAAKLLCLTVNGSLDLFFYGIPYREFELNLSEAITQGNAELAEKTMDSILEKILAETGLEFHKTKAACTKIVFMLYEITFKHVGCVFPEKDRRFSFHSLALADTLGKLKLCLTDARNDFMHGVFQNASLKRNAVVKQAIELIRRDYGKKINQNLIANSVYVSPSYFSKIFKEVTGCNFSQYLNRVRIEKAKEMLKKQTASIDEIYQTVGFENRSYFGKIFRRLTGTTPKRYRETFVREKRYN